MIPSGEDSYRWVGKQPVWFKNSACVSQCVKGRKTSPSNKLDVTSVLQHGVKFNGLGRQPREPGSGFAFSYGSSQRDLDPSPFFPLPNLPHMVVTMTQNRRREHCVPCLDSRGVRRGISGRDWKNCLVLSAPWAHTLWLHMHTQTGELTMWLCVIISVTEYSRCLYLTPEQKKWDINLIHKC